MERSIALERQAAAERVHETSRSAAEDRVLDQLLPLGDSGDDSDDQVERRKRTREKLREQLRSGGLNDRTIEVTVEEPLRCRT